MEHKDKAYDFEGYDFEWYDLSNNRPLIDGDVRTKKIVIMGVRKTRKRGPKWKRR